MIVRPLPLGILVGEDSRGLARLENPGMNF